MTAFVDDLAAGAVNPHAAWNAGLISMLVVFAVAATVRFWRDT